MPLEIRHLPPLRLAYMRHTGAYAHPGLTQLWERFGQWCNERGLDQPRPKFYGISHDDPACTPPEQCRYDACVRVGVGLRTGEQAQIQDFPGGSYACMKFVGTGPDIAAAWARMGDADPLPEGWMLDARAAVEIYDEDFAVDPATGVFSCWLCLAVKPRP